MLSPTHAIKMGLHSKLQLHKQSMFQLTTQSPTHVIMILCPPTQLQLYMIGFCLLKKTQHSPKTTQVPDLGCPDYKNLPAFEAAPPPHHQPSTDIHTPARVSHDTPLHAHQPALHAQVHVEYQRGHNHAHHGHQPDLHKHVHDEHQRGPHHVLQELTLQDS